MKDLRMTFWGDRKMTKRKIISAFLVFTVVMSGCGKKPSEGSSVKETSEETTTTSATSIETTETTTVETTTETTVPETTKAPEPFTFKPHVHTDLFSEYVTEEMWKALYNLIDAIRSGEDTFVCPNQETFTWATDSTVLGTFLPPAGCIVEGESFENGVGRIRYTIGKEAYQERESAFEAEVVRILNESIRTDYSDFEKLMGLYEYICLHFSYDNSSIDNVTVDEFSDYACMMSKKGICCEIAGVLAYLLMQCDVEAICFGSTNHDWNYVVLGGKGYFVDATWALTGNNPEYGVMLNYFLMTLDERLADGFEKDDLQVEQIWYWKRDYDISRFTATDTYFAPIHDYTVYRGMDTEKNVIRYKVGDEILELSYGDL